MTNRFVARPSVVLLFLTIALAALVAYYGFGSASGGGSGGPNVEARALSIETIPELATLPAPPSALVADASGDLWFPLFAADGLIRRDGLQDNRLYRYDPSSGSLTHVKLPGVWGTGDGGRIADDDESVIVGWIDRLWRITKSDGAVVEIILPPPSDPSPTRTGDIQDLLVSQGTIWIARTGLSSLWAVGQDGRIEEYPFAADLGTPFRLALSENGHVWMSMQNHAPASAAPGLEQVDSFAITVEFDPETGGAVSHPFPSAALARKGGQIKAIGGGPGGLRSWSGQSVRVESTAAGTNPGDFVAVDERSGVVWYTANDYGSLAAVFPDGQTRTVSLPTSTGYAMSSCPRQLCEQGKTVTVSMQISGVAPAPDGDLWFSSASGRFIAKASVD